MASLRQQAGRVQSKSRRERRFFEICMPGVRLRNNGSNVGPTSLLQMLIREMKKGEDGHYYGLG